MSHRSAVRTPRSATTGHPADSACQCISFESFAEQLVVFAAWHKEVGRSAGFFGELEQRCSSSEDAGTYAIMGNQHGRHSTHCLPGDV